jgi:hypothetical protein
MQISAYPRPIVGALAGTEAQGYAFAPHLAFAAFAESPRVFNIFPQQEIGTSRQLTKCIVMSFSAPAARVALVGLSATERRLEMHAS